MNERFRLNCAYILILSILFHSFTSHCYPQFLKDASSNAEDSNHVIEEQPNKLDPSIEQIFRGPSDEKNGLTNSKRNTETETSKTAVQTDEIDKRARIKRESVMKSGNAKNLDGGTKSNEKRSPSKANEASSRTSRSSRELPTLLEKDYEIPVDQDKSQYLDEPEDDSAVGPKSAESKYKGSEFHVGEDSEKYIDQDERSSLYDDFEAKDVVKRGISGAEDYEEMDEDSIGSAEGIVALEERGLSDEEVDKEKIHSDVRVKREPDSSKGADSTVAGEKAENAGIISDSSSDSKIAGTSAKRGATSEKDSEIAENQGSKVEKETDEQGERQSKRNVAEKIENNISKVNPDRVVDIPKKDLTGNGQTAIESNESAKLENQESQDTMGDRKTQEASLSSKEKVPNDELDESPSLKASSSSNSDESKIVDVSNPEASKLEVPVNTLDNAPSEDTAKIENSKGAAATGGQLDGDYEKRVEEQIQRKIDSIKEEIKREIAENQRVRDIKENNAKFDELREQEEDDGEDAIEADSSGKRSNLSKRSPENAGKSLARDTPEKRLIKRKKRQGETGQEKGASVADSRRKARQATAKKRSVAKSEQTSALNELPKKREYSREVFLVKRDSNATKKKRKVRSKNDILIPEQRSVKLEENLHADYVLDPSVRGELDAGKQSSLSKMSEDEKATAEQDSLLEKKFGSVASLTGIDGEMGPLATEYGEAFGGLHGEPGMALARFKRIKRVLRPADSKS